MFESIINFFKNIRKQDKEQVKSKDAAKERLHLVLMQDRANVSADFLDLMKQEIIEVIKKYIDVDENSIDVRLTNKANGDGTTGAPALYANIPIMSIKEEVRTKVTKKEDKTVEQKKEENTNTNNEQTVTEETKKDVTTENKEEKNEAKVEEANNNNEEQNKEEVKEENRNINETEKKEEIKN